MGLQPTPFGRLGTHPVSIFRHNESDSMAPLFLVATPIGNRGDLSPRARAILEDADVLLAEDTRRVRRLEVSLPRRILSYHAGNEAERHRQALQWLREGAKVVLVSEAGVPGISDPGRRLVAAAHAAGIPVHVIPGPSAITAALAAAGCPAVPFAFLGFLPKRKGRRVRYLEQFRAFPGSLVMFAGPHDLRAVVADLEALFPGRWLFLAHEMTKRHESYLWLPLPGAGAQLPEEIRGEWTLVLAPDGWQLPEENK